MQIPTERNALERAGYHSAGKSKCKRCGAPLEWFQTPNNRKMPFEERAPGRLEPHFSFCGNGGSLPHSGQAAERPRAPAQTSQHATELEQIAELLRMAQRLIDALVDKEKF